MTRTPSTSEMTAGLSSDHLQRLIDWLCSGAETGNTEWAKVALKMAWDLYWALHREGVHILCPTRPLPVEMTGLEPEPRTQPVGGSQGRSGVPKDMYGHEIHRLGDSGFGVSVDSGVPPGFWLFHDSDGFRQCLFMVGLPSPWKDKRPYIANVFDDRIAEVLGVLGILTEAGQ